MKNRCSSVNNHAYERYGGRGIMVCEDWQKYEPFKKWALDNGYTNELTIDRINVNGNYEPSNCKWSTYSEQNSNMRKTIRYMYNGEAHTINEWSKIMGINRSTLSNRIYSFKWPIEKALTEPVKGRKKQETNLPISA